MKKILLIAAILIGISLIAAGIESKYCHTYTTQPPFNAPDDYTKTSKFCDVNSQIAVPGLFILISIDALI